LQIPFLTDFIFLPNSIPCNFLSLHYRKLSNTTGRCIEHRISQLDDFWPKLSSCGTQYRVRMGRGLVFG